MKRPEKLPEKNAAGKSSGGKKAGKLKIMVIVLSCVYALLFLGALFEATVILGGRGNADLIIGIMQVVFVVTTTLPGLLFMLITLPLDWFGPRIFGKIWAICVIAVCVLLLAEAVLVLGDFRPTRRLANVLYYAGAIVPNLLTVYQIFLLEKARKAGKTA